MRNDKKNIIVNLSFNFALDIINFSELLEEKRKFLIARQLLKSGKAVGASVWEAQNAESKIDFIHKLKIAAKEADETVYWLRLCQLAKNYPKNDTLIPKLNELNMILSKIIATAKRNLN